MGIAFNIAKLREEHNLTQAEFGDIAGVTDRAVSSWEKGIAEPRMGALQKIADHFGIKKSDIIEDLNFSTSTFDVSEAEKELILKYRLLNDEGQEKVCDYVDDLVASEKYIKNGSAKLVEQA